MLAWYRYQNIECEDTVFQGSGHDALMTLDDLAHGSGTPAMPKCVIFGSHLDIYLVFCTGIAYFDANKVATTINL